MEFILFVGIYSYIFTHEQNWTMIFVVSWCVMATVGNNWNVQMKNRLSEWWDILSIECDSATRKKWGKSIRIDMEHSLRHIW